MKDLLNTLTRCWQATALGVAACVGVTAGAYALIVRPAFDERAQVDALRVTLDQKRTEVSDLDRKVIELRQQIDTFDQKAEAVLERIDPTMTVNQEVAALTDLASARGIEIDDLTVSESRLESEIRVYPIRMAGRAGYEQFARLLHDIDAASDANVVLDFMVRANPGDAANSIFELHLAWYVPVH